MTAIKEAMDPETADESPSWDHPWWKSKYLIYDIVMHILVLAFNVAAFLHVRHEKISIYGDRLQLLGNFYGCAAVVGLISWAILLTYTPEMHYRGGTMDRLSHLLGFAFLYVQFHSISPVFALCFGIPFSLWFLSVLVYTVYILCWG